MEMVVIALLMRPQLWYHLSAFLQASEEHYYKLERDATNKTNIGSTLVVNLLRHRNGGGMRRMLFLWLSLLLVLSCCVLLFVVCCCFATVFVVVYVWNTSCFEEPKF